LIIAAAYGHHDAIEVLLKHPEIDIDATEDGDKWVALTHAASSNCQIGVELLVKAGADVNFRDRNCGTPLMRAIDYGSWEAVQTLLDLGADPHCVDFLNRGILHSAAVNGMYITLRSLLELDLGLDVNAQGIDRRTPLHDAVLNSFSRCTQILVDHGAFVDIEDQMGSTALQMAIQEGYSPIIAVLRDAYAAMGPHDPKVRRSASQLSQPAPWWRMVQTMSAADLQERISQATLEEINAGAMPWEGSALHQACHYGRTDVVEMLLHKGADPNIQNAFARTPLFWAAESNKIAISRLLLKHGADVNLSSPGEVSIWETALYKGSDEIAVLLIENGAFIPKQSTRLQAALSKAVLQNSLAAVKALVAAGASLHVVSNGENAVQLAEDYERKEILEFFSEQNLSNPPPTSLLRQSTEGKIATGKMLKDDGEGALPSNLDVKQSGHEWGAPVFVWRNRPAMSSRELIVCSAGAVLLLLSFGITPMLFPRSAQSE
jgi:ankyrin repeat protein